MIGCIYHLSTKFMRFFLILAAVLPSVLCAQPTSKRTCRILFLDGPEAAPTELFLFDGTNTQKVELPRFNLSPIYEIANGAIRLCLLPAPPSDPKAIPTDAPAANVAESSGDIYLILGHDPKNRIAPVAMQIVDASAQKLSPGRMLWLNLTPHEIGGILGTQRLKMTANSRTVVDPPASRQEAFDVKISYRIKGETDFWPICETKWQHVPQIRSIVFVIGGKSAAHAPRIRRFTDFRPPSEKEEGTAQ